MTAPSDAAISADHVSHVFNVDGTVTNVLNDFCLSIKEGEFTAIIGPSGCGKTTFLNIVAGIEPLMSGTVTVAGSRPAAGRPDVGYAPVRDSLLPWRKAIDNAALQLELRGVSRAVRYQRAREVLAEMGLTNFEHMYPAQLSQGMRQRVALARLFAGDPKVLLLDEPFSALDAQTRMVVQGVFLKVWEEKRTTVVLITHDLAEAITLADRVVVVTKRPGRIKAIHDVSIPRPRSAATIRQSPEFHEAFDVVWNALRDEVS